MALSDQIDLLATRVGNEFRTVRAQLDPLTELGRNRMALWLPSGNSTIVPGIIGIPPLTATGTVVQRNVANTNGYTRRRKLGWVSGATAGGVTGLRSFAVQVTLGTGTLGGFRVITRFGCADAATVAGARQFVGASVNAGVPTNVEPSTIINSIGVGHGAADTNLKLFHGGTTAQPPIDLGPNFPANTLSVDAYELELFAPVTAATIQWTVRRLDTAFVATGTLGPGTAAVTLPASGMLLTPLQAWRTNNATALVVGLDFMSIATDVDY